MSESDLFVDFDASPLEFWSRAIQRIEERRKTDESPFLEQLENFAHACLSEEICRQERDS